MPARVLIVDDDELHHRLMQARLRDAAIEVRSVTDPFEALDAARDWRPDVILVDFMMPGMDGPEVLRRLRGDRRIRATRIYVVSAHGDEPEHRLAAFAAGADDVLFKPELSTAELKARIATAREINRALEFQEAWDSVARIVHGVGRDAEAPETDRRAAEDLLEEAITSIDLGFQPVVRLADDGAATPVAYEALLRCGTPRTASPLAVLHVARTLGDEAEQRLALAIHHRLASILEADRSGVDVLVNVELYELPILDATDHPLLPWAHRIVLEIVERDQLVDDPDFGAHVAALRAAGYSFALDDFGSGYANMRSLSILQPRYVKVDRDLVRGDPINPIIGSLRRICRDLGMEMIVEGVETVEQRDALVAIDCRLQQGWHHGRARVGGLGEVAVP